MSWQQHKIISVNTTLHTTNVLINEILKL